MQTFIPYPTIADSVAHLARDRRRLGKQRVEVVQILGTLAGRSRGWANHPAVRMWRHHARFLAEYGLVVCAAWTAFGYRDTCADRIRELAATFPESEAAAPPWWGRDDVHGSHLRALELKWQGRGDKARLQYVWPG